MYTIIRKENEENNNNNSSRKEVSAMWDDNSLCGLAD